MGGGEVGGHHLRQLSGRARFHGPAVVYAGVVHHRVQPATAFHHLRRQFLQRHQVGDVQGEGNRLGLATERGHRRL